jgi:hypothetical protein
MAAAGTLAAVISGPAQANRPGGSVETLQVTPAPGLTPHIHKSLLFGHKPGEPNVTPAQIRADIKPLTKRTALISLTEIINVQRANAVRFDGWGLCWPRGADSGLMFRKSLFSKKWSGAKRVSTARYYSELGNRWVLPQAITGCLLVEKATGKKVLVTVGHAVSCAFSRHNDGWIPANQLCTNGGTTANRAYINRNPLRVFAYKQHIKQWHQWVIDLTVRFTPDVVMTTGDFNLDFKKFWVRQYLGNIWKESQLGWQDWGRNDYTHLMRTLWGTKKILLDGTFISGEGVSFQHGSVPFPETVASDHSALEDVVQFTG